MRYRLRFTPPCRQPHSISLRSILAPFPENKVCYVRSLPWLKVIPTTTRHDNSYCSQPCVSVHIPFLGGFKTESSRDTRFLVNILLCK